MGLGVDVVGFFVHLKAGNIFKQARKIYEKLSLGTDAVAMEAEQVKETPANATDATIVNEETLAPEPEAKAATEEPAVEATTAPSTEETPMDTSTNVVEKTADPQPTGK